MSRTATIGRQTAETKITLSIGLDGTGRAQVATGVGFFDHMLVLLGKHSLIDLTVQASGDLHVDAHHTVEDVGICFGQALAQALGDKAGIRRYGCATLPMDEVLVTAAVDLSGRAFCVWRADVPPEVLGTFNAPLAAGNRQHRLRVSIGAAVYPAAGRNADELLANSHLAFCRAKATRRGSYGES